jgi:hypothetical protein
MKEEDIKEMSEKMQKMDEILNKDLFNNPVKEVQKKMQNDLLEFKRIFQKNLKDLNDEMSKNNFIVGDKNIEVSNEEMNDLKTSLEHKKYQVEILKREFNNYEQKSEEMIGNLKTENDKLKYRIKMLLNTISELENRKS